jgi:DNA polymerase-3 subunit delta
MQKLYHGKNKFLSLRAAHNLLREGFSNDEIVQIDADTIAAEKIIDAIHSPSLFSVPKIYFIKRLYRNKEKSALLNDLLTILSENEIPILLWEDQKIRGNTKYYKFFKENNAVEEFDQFNKRTFVSWAKKEIQEYPITLIENSLKTLAERSNYQPERFVNNLRKLTLIDKKEITEEILNTVIADTLETDIWKLMDSINKSDQKEINNILEKLLEYRVDPHYILAMIARNLRISIQIKHLLTKGVTAKKMASILKLPPFAIYPVLNAVKNIKRDRILLQYQKLANLDYEIKTGRIDPVLGLSLFTLVL